MLIHDERQHEINIPQVEKQRIMDFLQGAVYCWCKNRPDEPFGLQDLVGGENADWKGTPLQVLYERHLANGQDHIRAMTTAAQDAGWLLKGVLRADRRRFDSHDGYTKLYTWARNV